jgi:glutathione S-transferase
MSRGALTINSRRYGSWSLRGWLLCNFAGLEVDVEVQPSDDPSARAELLLLSPSFLVPRLRHDEVTSWGPTAIGEYLHEIHPDAGILPREAAARAHCRSVTGEMHSGFANLRSALPMNVDARHPGFKVWAGARSDIDRIEAIWQECLASYGGPYLFGSRPGLADAMFAPVCSRFVTYDVELDPRSADYRDTITELEAMQRWAADAASEPDDALEFDIEF